jgi:hypothetical protein
MMEYDFEIVPLNEMQRVAVEVGEIDDNSLCSKIKEILNKRSEQGWTPMPPFVMPVLWFSKAK